MSKRHALLTVALVISITATVSASAPWVEIIPIVSTEDKPDTEPYGPVGGWVFVEPTPFPSTTVPTVDNNIRKRVAATLATATHRATAVIITTAPPTRTTPVVRKPAPKKTTQAPAPAPVKVVAGSAAQAAVNFALAQEGDPYRWGANGPDEWDCSGLVNRAYASAGIQLTRSTRTLIHEGRSVPRSALVKGDLVFTHKGHVGLYVGNNKIVHAPQAGEDVKVSVIWAFYAARRVA